MDAETDTRAMVMDKIEHNALDLQQELNWLAQMIDLRWKRHFAKEKRVEGLVNIEPPPFNGSPSLYSSFISHYGLNWAERLILALSLAPHVRPQLLDIFFSQNKALGRGFTEIGGLKGTGHSGFLPTGETAMFVLAGDDLQQRFSFQYLFHRDHVFNKHGILKLEPAAEGEPFLSGALRISQDYLDYFTTGEIRKPDFSTQFPAKHITTQLEWRDLVLETNTLTQIEELLAWIEHGQTLMEDWGLSRKLRPGYRCLFYGPPGTGKTMTASLLGKTTGRDVYKIDLSTVVSKYIGETEKNLAKLFDQAEHKNWILFFDEADALFGKRTEVSDAHDKYANQEVSYLLQRIEDFNGVVILASNMKQNLDEAFARRFESIIHFPMPKMEERLRLWKEGFSKKSKFNGNLNLTQIAEKYQLSGGAIMNVVRYSSLMALKKGTHEIALGDLEEGIRKEFQKEGKTA